MIDTALFETMMDNAPDGIYVLDGAGNYLYVNSVYARMNGISKTEFLKTNVHDFLDTKQISECISDIVYREKRRVCMFQDVYEKHNANKMLYRQLLISTPVFGDHGEVCNIVAFVRPLSTMNDDYHQACASDAVSVISSKRPHLNGDIVAESPAMQSLLATAKAVADVESAVLITGESGTGKEVVSGYIHSSGKRGNNAMVVINCASLPPNLLEAELFGYEKGAFTGAATSKAGLFEEADNSTLFLDEINSLPLDLQGKLLRSIETKCIQRIGATKQREVNFRLIAATNEDLTTLVAERRFRSDLYYRLNVIPIHIPPLRERPEDILPLAVQFLNHYCGKYNKSKLFTQHTLRMIHQYDWPGNVRELKNFVERSVVMTAGDYIEIRNIQGIAQDTTSTSAPSAEPQSDFDYAQMISEGVSLDDYVGRCESAYVRYALQSYKSSYLAAEALGTSQASIIRKTKKYHLT